MLVVEGRREMPVLHADIAVRLRHSAMEIWNECSVVSTGYFSYYSTVTSSAMYI